MTEGVTIAIVTALGGVLVAMLALIGRINVRITRVARDAAVAREQVANDHVDRDGQPINLRTEADERHATVIAALKRIDRSVGGVRDDIRLLRSDHSALAERVHGIERRELEDTQPKKEHP